MLLLPVVQVGACDIENEDKISTKAKNAILVFSILRKYGVLTEKSTMERIYSTVSIQVDGFVLNNYILCEILHTDCGFKLSSRMPGLGHYCSRSSSKWSRLCETSIRLFALR